ncbi:MAG: CPXCG motif-containing cysteine-rich protein [Anaerolineae bacterium]|nr:CPXCG motif-containing cysteine-rich protein [Anaerolineae bacterium]
MEEEYFFICPHCWQEISMLLDTSSGDQSYIEDCEICCNPIEITYRVEDNTIISFEANVLE